MDVQTKFSGGLGPPRKVCTRAAGSQGLGGILCRRQGLLPTGLASGHTDVRHKSSLSSLCEGTQKAWKSARWEFTSVGGTARNVFAL